MDPEIQAPTLKNKLHVPRVSPCTPPDAPGFAHRENFSTSGFPIPARSAPARPAPAAPQACGRTALPARRAPTQLAAVAIRSNEGRSGAGPIAGPRRVRTPLAGCGSQRSRRPGPRPAERRRLVLRRELADALPGARVGRPHAACPGGAARGGAGGSDRGRWAHSPRGRRRIGAQPGYAPDCRPAACARRTRALRPAGRRAVRGRRTRGIRRRSLTWERLSLPRLLLPLLPDYRGPAARPAPAPPAPRPGPASRPPGSA